MRRPTAWLLVAAAVVGLGLAGCRKARKQYDKVGLGMTRAEVRKILGAPQYEFADEWVYTGSAAADLARATVYFSGDGKVVGKCWRDPGHPSEDHQVGQMPGAVGPP